MLLIRLGGSDTPDATFLGMALGVRASREGVEVPRGTYSGSRSSSEPMTMYEDGAIDFDQNVRRFGLSWVP